MDFTRLNLKKYLAEGTTATNNLASTAGLKTSNFVKDSSSDQHDPVRKNMQLKQRSARTGHTSMTDTVDISPSAGPTAESFINQRNAIERRKLIEKNKIDWRKEIMEAVNPDDEPDHPYVEIMPHFRYKEKEAKKNAFEAGAKDKANNNGPAATGVNEESIKAKKDSGKAIPVGKGARNLDNTATPRENVARRVANKVPDKSKAQKKMIEPMTIDMDEDWQQVNRSDKTDGMSKKAITAYRDENPNSKLKPAVTGKPKEGSKDADRKASYCRRSAGQQKMHNIDCSSKPDKPICKARKRWNC